MGMLLRALTRGSSRKNPTRRVLGFSFEQLETRDLLAALTWSPGVSLPTPRAGLAAIETAAQTILVVGGGTTTVNQLSSGSNSWGTATAIDIARVSPGIGATGSNFLVYGGSSGSTPLEEALTYNPYNIDLVQDAAVLHTPRTQFGYATDNNQPYAIGGLGSGNSVLSSVERYSSAQDSWATVASLPQGRFAFAAVDDGAGHIFTFGGATANSASSVSSTVYRYTVATNSWQTMTAMPIATRDSAAVLASNGRIYVLGGSSGSATIATVQSYDPVANTWRSETDLPSPVRAAAAVTDAAGRIEVIGGYNQSNAAVSTVTVSQALNVPDIGPAITSTAPTTVLTGSIYTYQVIASGNPQPTYALVTAPTGMTINPGTGLISWTPSVAQAGLNSVTVRATNVVGSADQSFSVRALTPAPTIPTALHVTGVTTNSVTLGWSPSTDSVGVAGYRVYRVTHTGFHGITTVRTLYADVPGTSATISVPTAGSSYTFVVAAYNASGNQSGYSGSTVATTLSPPSYFGPTSLYATANHPISFTLSTGGNPATFTYSAVSVPAGMTVNPTTGLVSWTPPDSAVGTGYYSFSITNGVGTVTPVVSIQVSPNLPNVTYTQNSPAIVTQPLSVQFNQTNDPYNTAPVTYSLVTAPTGVTINPTTGLMEWTPGLADVGNASFTVRTTNYAGTRDTSLTIPVTFASAVRNVVASNVNTTGATLNWLPPDISASPIQGYHITASYVTHSGRFNTTHTLNYSTAGATSIVLTGLPSSKLISISVKAFDAAGHDGIGGTTSFSTAYATPTIAITGGPFVYNGATHGAAAVAYGVNGVTPVSGSFTLTYNGLDTLPVEPGTYAVEAIFTSADSYYADTIGTGSLVILPATPTIIVDGGPFVYDGTTHAVSATAYALDGSTPISGSFAYSYEGSTTPPSNPGLYAVAATFTSNDPRYATYTSAGELRITSVGVSLPVIALSNNSVTYDGSAHGLGVSAFQTNGITPLEGTFSPFTYNGQPTIPTDAGTYLVSGTFYSRDPNYADAVVSGTLTIHSAAPSVTIYSDYVFSGYPQDASAAAVGVDGVSPIDGVFSFTYDGSSTPPTNAGTYSVVASFTSYDSNYTDSITTGSMTIAPATPWVLAMGGEVAYDGAAHAGQGIVYDIDGYTVLSDAPAISYLSYDLNTGTFVPLATTPVDAGYYLVVATYTSNNPNYADSVGYDYLIIDQATPTVTINGGPFNYTETSHAAAVTVYGIDGVTPVAGSLTITYDGSTTPPSDAGAYAVVATFVSSDPNYVDVTSTGTLIINPSVQLLANQQDPNLFDLVWTGTSGIDHVSFIQIDATTIRVDMLMENGFATDTEWTFEGVTGLIIASGDAGDDIVDASAITTTSVQLSGGAGSDVLRGGEASDILIGDAPGLLLSALGHDSIFGGDGDDLIYGDSDGGEGNGDSISGGAGNDYIIADGSRGATSANDTIDGGTGDDSIAADGSEGGKDVVTAGDGNDWVDAGGGADSVAGGIGDDVLIGGDGAEGAADTLLGGDGRDILVGDMGNLPHRIVSGGADSLDGGNGEDIVIAGAYLPTDDIALAAIQWEWTSARSYAERVADISGASGGVGDNGTYFLTAGTNVFNDRTSAQSPTTLVVDHVLGGNDADWLFYDVTEDIATDKTASELAVDLRPYPVA